MNKALNASYLASICVFLYLPLAVIVVLSFNSASHSLLWHHFSMQWYIALLHDKELSIVVEHSIVLATLASTLAVGLGLLAAVMLYRYRFQGKQWVHLMLFILIILPDLVLGIALLLFYDACHLPLGFVSLLLAHVTFCLPFSCVIIYNRLQQLDPYIIEAARDLSATESKLYSKIIVPLTFTSMLAAWLLSFTLSLDDVVISYFVSGPSYEILPLRIFSMVRLGISPEINALCTILLLFTFCWFCLHTLSLMQNLLSEANICDIC